MYALLPHSYLFICRTGVWYDATRKIERCLTGPSRNCLQPCRAALAMHFVLKKRKKEKEGSRMTQNVTMNATPDRCVYCVCLFLWQRRGRWNRWRSSTQSCWTPMAVWGCSLSTQDKLLQVNWLISTTGNLQLQILCSTLLLSTHRPHFLTVITVVFITSFFQ